MISIKKLLFVNSEINYDLLGPKRKSLAQLGALSELFNVDHVHLKINKNNRFRRAINFYVSYPFQVFIKAIKNKGCFVYYRYYPHCFLLNLIFFLLRKKISLYVEVNTKHRDEFKNEILKFYVQNLFSEKLIYQAAHTVLVITPEVGEYVRSIEPQAQIRVMGNGYDPAEIDLEGEELHNDNLLELENLISKAGGRHKLIWVGGVFYWIGLDKIFGIMSGLENACLYLVGSLDKLRHLGINPENTMPNQVFFLGQRNLTELKYFYNHCDFGFGNFGLDKKNQKENPTLKVREYLYFGLPVIIGHCDPQLQGLDFVHLYHNMNALRQFLAQPFDREKIKQYARTHLSWRTIMRHIFEPELLRISAKLNPDPGCI